MHQSRPTPAQYRPIDPMLARQMPFVKGILNRPDQYSFRKVWQIADTGDRFVMEPPDGMGNTFTIQRLDAATVMKNAGLKTRRSPGADIRVTEGPTLDPITGVCYEHSIGSPSDLLIASRAQGIKLEAAASAINIEILSVSEEYDFGVTLSTKALWHPNSADVGVAWNDPTSKPAQDIGDAARDTNGETVFFGWTAWWDFCWNQNILEGMPDNEERNGIDVRGALRVLAKMGITKIIIGSARMYNAAGEIVDIHGDFAWVGACDAYLMSLGGGTFQVTFQAGLIVTERLPETMPGSLYLPDGTLIEAIPVPIKRKRIITAGRSYAHQITNRYAGIVLGNTHQ